MLVIKKDECEYLGYQKGRHVIKRPNGSIEAVKEFKMIIDPDTVEVYRADGNHSPSFATQRRQSIAN